MSTSWLTLSEGITPPTTTSSPSWWAESALASNRLTAPTTSSPGCATRLTRLQRVGSAVTEQPTTIPITYGLDGQGREVPGQSVAAGQRTRQYQALCRYLVSAAAMATPSAGPALAAPSAARRWRSRRSRHGRAGEPARRQLRHSPPNDGSQRR